MRARSNTNPAPDSYRAELMTQRVKGALRPSAQWARNTVRFLKLLTPRNNPCLARAASCCRGSAPSVVVRRDAEVAPKGSGVIPGGSEKLRGGDGNPVIDRPSPLLHPTGTVSVLLIQLLSARKHPHLHLDRPLDRSTRADRTPGPRGTHGGSHEPTSQHRKPGRRQNLSRRPHHNHRSHPRRQLPAR